MLTSSTNDSTVNGAGCGMKFLIVGEAATVYLKYNTN